MRSHTRTLSALAFATIGLALAAGDAPALASPASEAQELFRKELRQCAIGASVQGRETCAYEARSAYAQNLRGGLDDANPRYVRNARERCDVMVGAERVACEARMAGQGKVTGSVAEGGVLRELTTRSPAPAVSTAAPVKPAGPPTPPVAPLPPASSPAPTSPPEPPLPR